MRVYVSVCVCVPGAVDKSAMCESIFEVILAALEVAGSIGRWRIQSRAHHVPLAMQSLQGTLIRGEERISCIVLAAHGTLGIKVTSSGVLVRCSCANVLWVAPVNTRVDTREMTDPSRGKGWMIEFMTPNGWSIIFL